MSFRSRSNSNSRSGSASAKGGRSGISSTGNNSRRARPLFVGPLPSTTGGAAPSIASPSRAPVSMVRAGSSTVNPSAINGSSAASSSRLPSSLAITNSSRPGLSQMTSSQLAGSNVGLAPSDFGSDFVPASTCLSTTTSLILYLVIMILILSTKCPFDQDVIYFFSFVLLAFIMSIVVLRINSLHKRFHWNVLFLTINLFNSGSICLVVFGLIHTAINGLCKPDNTKAGSIFEVGVVTNYFIYAMAIIAVGWQFEAHFYYG